MKTEHHELYSPAIGTAGTVAVFGHYGRPLLAFPSEAGKAYDWRDMGMIGAVEGLIEAGRAKGYCVDSFDAGSWAANHPSPEKRAPPHRPHGAWVFEQGVAVIPPTTGGESNV